MLKAILFDLDGTLLPMDHDVFLENYFNCLSKEFYPDFEADFFKKSVWQATKAMVKNNDRNKYNQEIFIETFVPLVNRSAEYLLPLFDSFYQKNFSSLEQYANPTDLAKKIVSTAQTKGYKLALATNPIFPLVATQHRMKWACVDQYPWDVVTSYENSHFCKPNPAYFTEIIEKLGVKPEEALMVGNDILEDLVATEAGIKTYLVTDCSVKRSNTPYSADYSGTLADFYQFLQKL